MVVCVRVLFHRSLVRCFFHIHLFCFDFEQLKRLSCDDGTSELSFACTHDRAQMYGASEIVKLAAIKENRNERRPSKLGENVNIAADALV